MAGRRACSGGPRGPLPSGPASCTRAGQEDDLLVHHYVLHEVLANEAAEVIDILSAAAVVPRIDSVLAHALTGRSDAGELLQTAEERGLFLTHRGTGGWFDLHALIREVLITDLAGRHRAG